MKSNKELKILEEIAERLPLIKDERLGCTVNIQEDKLNIDYVGQYYPIVIDSNLVVEDYNEEDVIHLWDLIQENEILYSLALDKIKGLPEHNQVILAYVVQIIRLLQESEGE